MLSTSFPSQTGNTLSPIVTVGIMGTPLTSGNRGVQALGSALARLCLEAGPNVQVLFYGSHPRAESVVMRPQGRSVPFEVIHWRMSPKGGLRHQLFVIVFASLIYRCIPVTALRRWIATTIPWIGMLEKTDLVGDVRGGDSFSDIYGLKRFLIATLPILSVIWVKRNLVLFPQTYGPFNSRIARRIARWIIRHSTIVIARDKASQAIAQKLARPGQTVLLSPDVAFALHADVMETALFNSELKPLPIPENVIGLNVNGLMYNGGYTGKNMFGLKLDYPRFLTSLATQLLSLHPGPLLLVPHTFGPVGNVESDNEACMLLKDSLPAELQARVFIVTGDYDAHQLKGIIAKCNFFVGSRMHSCIAALSQGVPCVGVAYSMKFRGVFESVGMADWIVDGGTTGNDTAVKLICDFLADRYSQRTELIKASSQARARLGEFFTDLLGLSKG